MKKFNCTHCSDNGLCVHPKLDDLKKDDQRRKCLIKTSALKNCVHYADPDDSKLETDIEQAFRRHCRDNGFKAEKFVIEGQRNHPDQQIFLGYGYSFFIEWKRKGEEPRKAQLSRIRKWKAKGYHVHVIDDLYTAKITLVFEVAHLEKLLGRKIT